MAFIETPRFPENISYGAMSGPEFQTNVIVVNSGYESRNINWSTARARFDVGHKGRTKAETDALVAFFRAVKGKGHGFRFKDWTDYQVTLATGRTLKQPGLKFQLQKLYASGTLSELRTISKPVAGTVSVQRNGVTVSTGTGAGQYTLDTTTGKITFTEDLRVVITSITKANPGVVTTLVPHGFTTGMVIDLSTSIGMLELNQAIATITVLSPTTFSIGINTSGYSTFITGGVALKTVQPGESLYWQGEFDVPCRFDSDQMQIEIMDKGIYSWGQIPIMEIRT
jgi:uncharacterized protein (TIGR02217 family)